MKHIEGKLVVRDGWVCAEKDERNVANCRVGGWESEEAEANARRVAACWNACDGTHNEALERGLEGHPQPVLNLAMVNQSLMEQRQELVEALRQADRLFTEALPKFNWAASFLDANAIQLLNETPRRVKELLAQYSEGRVYLKDLATNTPEGHA